MLIIEVKNLEYIVLSEESQTQKFTGCMILGIRNVQNRQSIKTEYTLAVVKGSRKGRIWNDGLMVWIFPRWW